MTRLELVKKSDEMATYSKRISLPLLTYVMLLAVFLWWANFHREILPEKAIGLFGIFGFFGIYVIVIAFGMSAKRQRRKLELVCPACKRDLIGGSLQLAIASGRCGRCGAVILEDWNKL